MQKEYRAYLLNSKFFKVISYLKSCIKSLLWNYDPLWFIELYFLIIVGPVISFLSFKGYSFIGI